MTLEDYCRIAVDATVTGGPGVPSSVGGAAVGGANVIWLGCLCRIAEGVTPSQARGRSRACVLGAGTSEL